MGMVSRVDAYQRRHRWAGLPLAVLYKFADDQGTYLAAQITYYGFVALFPLLLLLATILGYALHGNPHLQHKVLDSALAQFPVIGDQITANIRSFHGSTAGLVIGMLGCVYGGLGIVQAAQTMLNKVWGVPRNSRPNPLRSRLRSLLLLAVGGASVIITTVLSALGAAGGSYGASLGGSVRALATALAVTLNVALFIAAFRVLTASAVTIREVRAGAVAAAVVWQALQWAGALLLGHELKGATATYGLFALVLGLLAWIYLGAVTTVICAEYNAVRAGQLWPRSLLTPFTDNADLTPADQRAYTSYAKTERHKSFQNIDVSFGKPPAPDPRNQNPERLTSAGDRTAAETSAPASPQVSRDLAAGPAASRARPGAGHLARRRRPALRTASPPASQRNGLSAVSAVRLVQPGTVALVDRGCRETEPVTSSRAVSVFVGFRFPPEVISVAVRWYLRYGLSYRDVEELLAERGITVDHVTIYRWVQRFTPEFIEAARPCRHAPGDRRFVNETYVKVAGRWTYLYRAVDQHGQVVDVLLSVRRDLAAARRFLTRALRAGTVPAEVTTDRAPVYSRVLDELVPSALHTV